MKTVTRPQDQIRVPGVVCWQHYLLRHRATLQIFIDRYISCVYRCINASLYAFVPCHEVLKDQQHPYKWSHCMTRARRGQL